MDKNEAEELFGICPYVTTQKLFSGKWSLLIMHLLQEKTMRFGELQRALGDITQTTLTKQLRFLEDYNLIQRKVFNTIPPKVEYSLTGIGTEFMPVIQALAVFGDSYITFMKTKKQNVKKE
ncbi:MAG: helix-turn-helix transcriptional regulator [Treponema sp.]|nr:helix-turn-helix transcriptional regulator [Treponema sp.]